MELCSEKFVSETTFSKYYSFGAGGDFINPKVCQKVWRKGNLSLSTRF